MNKRRPKKPAPYSGPLTELLIMEWGYRKLVLGAEWHLRDLKQFHESLRNKVAKEQDKFNAAKP